MRPGYRSSIFPKPVAGSRRRNWPRLSVSTDRASYDCSISFAGQDWSSGAPTSQTGVRGLSISPLPVCSESQNSVRNCPEEIGRESVREEVDKYVEITVGAGT